MAISRIQWQSSSRIRRSNGRSLEIHHESRTFSFCPRAAGLPKERFQTPPKNKLALPVGSRALSHRFCTHRTPEREERGSSKFLLLLFYSSFFSLSFIFSLVISRVSRTSIFERNRDSRFSTTDRQSKHTSPGCSYKNREFPLEIDPPRSTFAEHSHETGSTGRSNKGVHGLRTNLSRLAEHCVTSWENQTNRTNIYRWNWS